MNREQIQRPLLSVLRRLRAQDFTVSGSTIWSVELNAEEAAHLCDLLATLGSWCEMHDQPSVGNPPRCIECEGADQ